MAIETLVLCRRTTVIYNQNGRFIITLNILDVVSWFPFFFRGKRLFIPNENVIGLGLWSRGQT